VDGENLAVVFVKVILALALVGGLFVAGWSVYRRLPSDPSEARNIEAHERAKTSLSIVLSIGTTDAKFSSPVELYPFDLTAAQREFQAIPRPGKQFDDFLARRMQGVTPVKALPDSNGRAIALLSEGNWWLRAAATFANGERLEWRLPVSVSKQGQTVELTIGNAYEHTKKF